MQGRTYPNVRLLGVTLNAYHFFWLGVRPKIFTVADKMLTIASNTGSFGYSLIIICNQMKVSEPQEHFASLNSFSGYPVSA
jgi:hypothetical protein